MDGNSNPCLLISANEVDGNVISTPEVVGIDPDDPGWNPVVNALRDGGRPISLNTPDIWGSKDDTPLPSDDALNPKILPVYDKL